LPAYDESFAPAAPVAKVKVSHPDGEPSIADVPMLIDSGADATLLPRSVVAPLGLVSTGEPYQVEGFDGSTSESKAVRAVVVFLNKTFRGRFLLAESEVGAIGRNVLNHVRLLLDGPGLSWEELPLTSKEAQTTE